MNNFKMIFLAALCVVACNKNTGKKETKQTKEISLTSYVDPFIGTGGHGHTYPGATVPFGMLQVSPVNGISKWDWCSGYHYTDSIMVGFSHLSLSGTGIGDLADVLLMPVNKKVDITPTPTTRDSLTYKSSYNHQNEKATPGYYQVYLEDHDVNVELTTSLRTAHHKYTYQQNDPQTVVLNLGFGINWDKATATNIQIENEYTISGYRHSKGWAKNQKVFFTAKFSKPITHSVLVADGKEVEKINNNAVKTCSSILFR